LSYNTCIRGNVTRKLFVWSSLTSKMLFFKIKMENRRAEQVLSGEFVPVGGGGVGKGCRRVNMVQILCTHVCKWKNETC
jgi:hypothetical protein